MEQSGKSDHPPTPELVNNGDEFVPGEFVVVNGLRYVIPYHNRMLLSVKDQFIGIKVDEMLGNIFRRHRGEQDLDEAIAHWHKEVLEGRISIRRRKTSRDDPWQFAECTPHTIICKGDTIAITQHVHERVVMGEAPQIIHETPQYIVVNKPSGLPCLGSEGINDVLGVAKKAFNRERLFLCHRLDLPVSGTLILAKNGHGSRKALEAMAKREGVVKNYVARICGRLPQPRVEVNVPVKFNNLANRAFASPSDEGNTSSTTFTELHVFEDDNTSLVRCELNTGHRHQIRAHLAYLGCPIANDIAYHNKDGHLCAFNGDHGPYVPKIYAYKDDDKSTLTRMTLDERIFQPWCARCHWALRALSNTLETNPPIVEHLIYLHSCHYKIPSLNVDATSSLPPWAEY